jgi:aldehyde dehydrogenase (NAD+)
VQPQEIKVMQAILEKLGIEAVNDGTWFGSESVSDDSAPLIESTNPATDEVIARVRATTMAQYEDVIAKAQESFVKWRAVPAPVRGEAVRQIANALRKHKDALGSLVALENGKIKAEGDGEVQEMIDIADFAVGQSRMLYGRTMHSERPQHRMYEQWHPLGLVGTISAFNFPVAVYAWKEAVAQYGAVRPGCAEDHQRSARGYGPAARLLPDQRRFGYA